MKQGEKKSLSAFGDILNMKMWQILEFKKSALLLQSMWYYRAQGWANLHV